MTLLCCNDEGVLLVRTLLFHYLEYFQKSSELCNLFVLTILFGETSKTRIFEGNVTSQTFTESPPAMYGAAVGLLLLFVMVCDVFSLFLASSLCLFGTCSPTQMMSSHIETRDKHQMSKFEMIGKHVTSEFKI